MTWKFTSMIFERESVTGVEESITSAVALMNFPSGGSSPIAVLNLGRSLHDSRHIVSSSSILMRMLTRNQLTKCPGKVNIISVSRES
jgi:hypothetical protein